MSKWQPIETLTRDDGYVIGWSGRDDELSEREYFIGCQHDMRMDALTNEWTGRWRAVTYWMPLPAPPTDAPGDGS